MNTLKPSSAFTLVIGLTVLGSFLVASTAGAHCDTLEGPVVKTARLALDKGDVTPVLKWVRPADEPEIRDLFQKTLAARKQGPEVRELVDRYFFETLVRIHRAGEGASFTGLKPAGTPVEPAIALADAALASGDSDRLAKAIAGHVEEGIRHRFARALETKKHADDSVAAGREFVAAYVELTHYVERLHADATTDAGHAGSSPAAHKH